MKLRAIYKRLKDFCERTEPDDYLSEQIRNFRKTQLTGFVKYLEFLITNEILFENIRFLLMGHTSYQVPAGIEYRLKNFQSAIIYVTKFLHSIGYHGLRCSEVGEDERSAYPWEKSMSYIVFNPEDIEIISEEYYALRNGKIVRSK